MTSRHLSSPKHSMFEKPPDLLFKRISLLCRSSAKSGSRSLLTFCDLSFCSALKMQSDFKSVNYEDNWLSSYFYERCFFFKILKGLLPDCLVFLFLVFHFVRQVAPNEHYEMINIAEEEMNYEEIPYDHPPVCAFVCGETHKDLIYFCWKVLSWIVVFEPMSIFFFGKETFCIHIKTSYWTSKLRSYKRLEIWVGVM